MMNAAKLSLLKSRILNELYMCGIGQYM